MPYFCIFAHPRMPLVRASVEGRPKTETRDGFVLRLKISIPPEWTEHADRVIDELDKAMGAAKKAHGVYQARYETVLDAYRGLERSPEPVDWSPPLRAAALIVGVALTAVMCVVVPLATIIFLFVSAVKRQSGLSAMAESAVIWSVVDMRPTIHKLFRYARGDSW